MITKLQGTLQEKHEYTIVVEVNGLSYEIWIPRTVMDSFDELDIGQPIRLEVYHYIQNDGSKGIPVLIGFTNRVQKEFFELFITVTSIGPKSAVKSLTIPFSAVAKAIDQADYNTLKSLPGIGTQKAKEIVAKLQGKVAKFGLLRDEIQTKEIIKPAGHFVDEVKEILVQLQYKHNEIEQMINQALDRNPRINSSEELLSEIYQHHENKK